MNDAVFEAVVSVVRGADDYQLKVIVGSVKEKLVEKMIRSRFEMSMSEIDKTMVFLIKEEARNAGLRITAH